MRFEVLPVHETTRCRSSVAIAVRMESRLTKVGGHGTVRKKTTLEFQLLQLFANALLLLF